MLASATNSASGGAAACRNSDRSSIPTTGREPGPRPQIAALAAAQLAAEEPAAAATGGAAEEIAGRRAEDVGKVPAAASRAAERITARGAEDAGEAAAVAGALVRADHLR